MLGFHVHQRCLRVLAGSGVVVQKIHEGGGLGSGTDDPDFRGDKQAPQVH